MTNVTAKACWRTADKVRERLGLTHNEMRIYLNENMSPDHYVAGITEQDIPMDFSEQESLSYLVRIYSQLSSNLMQMTSDGIRPDFEAIKRWMNIRNELLEFRTPREMLFDLDGAEAVLAILNCDGYL